MTENYMDIGIEVITSEVDKAIKELEKDEFKKELIKCFKNTNGNLKNGEFAITYIREWGKFDLVVYIDSLNGCDYKIKLKEVKFY